jgi:hypothetical protein
MRKGRIYVSCYKILIQFLALFVFSTSLCPQTNANKAPKNYEKVTAKIAPVKGYSGDNWGTPPGRLINLRIWKNIKTGTLLIRFGLLPPPCGSCRFLIRLFDLNGNYLTHFMTERQWQLPFWSDFHNHPEKDQHFELKYDVNVRELRDASIVEFGIVTHESLNER